MNTVQRALCRRIRCRRYSTNILKNPSKCMDAMQVKAMQDLCFHVDDNDKVIGHLSKKICHSVQPNGKIPLHRGFSIFIFNEDGHMLVHKRSEEKITYPGCYTNTCCSHPIANVAGEDEENNALGIKKAARRRLNYELGIPVDQIPLESLKYITRIHYKDLGDGTWGEHEIGYLLIMQANVHIDPNPNEISEVCYVPRNEIDDYLSKRPVTPWFLLYLNFKLRDWWGNLNNLSKFEDHQTISKLN